MYARVTTFYLSLKMMEEATEVYKNSIIPAAQNQKGFKNAFFLTNSNAGKFVSITIWENLEFALANQKSGYYQEQLDKFESFMVVQPEVEGFSVGALSI
jgi:heme-degrading monooxygenase HmoA